MSKTNNYDHLVHIRNHHDLTLYALIPNPVWVFDIDKHGWWWGNDAAIKFWSLDSLQQLIDKDLSGDTKGARDRTVQTFELAAKHGLTTDPWTTYPQGKPKTVLMMHRAVLLGEDKHRGIIAFINDQVNLGEQPENLLLVDAMRYTRVPATTFTVEGNIVIENPSATECYKHLLKSQHIIQNPFVARFSDHNQGQACLQKVRNGEEGRWKYLMQTSAGIRRHSLDIRRTRHPLSGEFLFLMVEYDLTELHQALEQVEASRDKLHQIAMHDTLTGVYSLHYIQEVAKTEIARVIRQQQMLQLLFIDLDGFKAVNDTMGHEAGDEVLSVTAKRIQSQVRAQDLVARIGGDEFVVLLITTNQDEDETTVVNRILTEIKHPIVTESGIANISASIGIANCPDHGDDLDALLKAADKAMYKVKKQGKNAFLAAE